MSDQLRIALIAEGPTDLEVIQAALKAILPDPFILTLLQPEETQPQRGTGWGGVLKWCHEAYQRHDGPLCEDPTLLSFNFIIIHVDVDVALKQYSDCGATVEAWAEEHLWESLPCAQTCPPVSDTVDALVKVIKSWLVRTEPGNCTLFCLPAQSSGTWLAAAVLPAAHPLLANAECDETVESKLGQLPKAQRIKKKPREYRVHAPNITEQWEQVKQICSQAEQFEHSVLAALNLDCESPA